MNMMIYRLLTLLRLGAPMLALLLSLPAQAQEEAESVYVTIAPSFITNYDEGARLKYLKTTVALQVPAMDEMTIRHHLPSIQNRLVILFTSQAEENLTSTIGREALRREALDQVREVMAGLERSGDDQVTDLFFTDFVVQQ